MNIKINKITIALFSTLCLGSSFAQNKSLAQIQYEAIYGPIKDEKKEPNPNKPQGKYDHLTPDQKQRYEEIDRQNSELLSKNPQDYVKKSTPKGTLADPTSGSFTQPINPVNQTNHFQNNRPQYQSAFGAMNHRSISDLVTSWSGREGQYLLWNYSKDYDIYNSSLFNQETKLNEALGLDDALQKIFRYIAFKESTNIRHLPPKTCFEGNTILIVDNNVDC